MSDPNLKVNAMLSALQQQRDAANNTVVQLAAQVAELEARINELEAGESAKNESKKVTE